MTADIAMFMADIMIFMADIAIIMANIAILWPKTDCQVKKCTKIATLEMYRKFAIFCSPRGGGTKGPEGGTISPEGGGARVPYATPPDPPLPGLNTICQSFTYSVIIG